MPTAAGPAERDLSTVAHSYSSTVDPVSDYYSGLVGISMIASAGQLVSNTQVRLPGNIQSFVIGWSLETCPRPDVCRSRTSKQSPRHQLYCDALSDVSSD